MGFADKKMKKGVETDFIITSVGACLAEPKDKKKPSCVVIAYKTSAATEETAFVFTEMPPKNKLLDRMGILEVIARAEGVKNVTYVGHDGQPKDIYFCRADKGLITDVVERDYLNNRYASGFTEVFASNVKFSLEKIEGGVRKFNKRLQMQISGLTVSQYEEGSYEYAIINAHNACLLGRIFEREELQLQTKSGKRVRFEVRNINSAFVEHDVLYIRPIFRESENQVDYYLTEEFSYTDGRDVSSRAYKIIYTNRLNDYILTKI